ncbi:MAG: hypothetical protein EHM49_09070 [Deltaproteobacteria bacterium]|nr:MAG: hypothetical protein EHM49_09070 [Deltaproteobacteria bacterium]
MSPLALKETERIIRFAKSIGSVRPNKVPANVGYSDRFAWTGPATLGRKAVKVSMLIEKRQFKDFMKRVKDGQL